MLRLYIILGGFFSVTLALVLLQPSLESAPASPVKAEEVTRDEVNLLNKVADEIPAPVTATEPADSLQALTSAALGNITRASAPAPQDGAKGSSLFALVQRALATNSPESAAYTAALAAEAALH